MRHFFKYKFYIIAFLFLSQNVFSQDTLGFQRAYFGDNTIISNIASAPLADGGYYILNVRVNVTNNVTSLHVSRHNVKGNISWATDYIFENRIFAFNTKSLSTEVLDDNSLFITAVSFDAASGLVNDEKVMIRIEATAGDLVWSNVVQDLNDGLTNILTFPSMTIDAEGDINIFSMQSSDTLAIHHNRYSQEDSLKSSNTYALTDLSGNLLLGATLDASSNADTSNAVLAVLEAESQTSGLLNIDFDGEPIFSSRYSISPDSVAFGIFQKYIISATPDTGYVIAGISVDQLTGGLNNLVTKVDSLGNIEWTRAIDGSARGLIAQVNDVLYTSQNELMVTCKYINVLTGLAGDISIFLDLSGNVIRQYDYNSENSLFILNTGQQNLQFTYGESNNTFDGGILYTTSAIDIMEGTVGSYAIVMDSIGQARCNDTLSIDIVSPYELVTDSMLVVRTNFATTDTLELISEKYNDYTTPVLMLLDTTFCPQDPVVALLEAFVEGASAYEWSTGETTESITVTEEGEYSVTVTVDDKVCYMLCDTSNIIQLDFPEAQLTVDDSFLCEQDFIRISAALTAGAGARDYSWESGETTSSIDITGPGDYRVTITDNCDNTAVADVSLIPDNFNLEYNLEIFSNTNQTCNTGNVILTANTSSPVVSYNWSNGEVARSILVSDPGTYVVTVNYICDEFREASIVVTAQDFELPELDVDIISGAFDCEEGILLSVNNITNSQISSYAWSTGAVTDTFRIFSPGEYSLTVTDICGSTASATTTVESGELNMLVYPNIFFPNSNIDINQSFGPHLECPELFDGQDYSLEIFNRWGNKVFESERVQDRWNGRINNMGDLIQEDVYLFIYSYTDTNNEEIKGNGSVTLSR